MKQRKTGKRLLSLAVMLTLLLSLVGTAWAASEDATAEAPADSSGEVTASAAAPAADGLKYYNDFDSLEEAKAAAEDLTKELVSEGAILMKNDGSLPLQGDEWISVFGVRADSLIGASDSGGGGFSSGGGGGTTVAQALASVGFHVNPTLEAFYSLDASGIGSEVTDFDGKVLESMGMYNDAAVIVFSREGGEGSDVPTTKAANGASEEISAADEPHEALYTSDGKTYKHSLMLTDSERALVELVKTKFSKIIVLLNTSNAMEIASLKNDPAISAIIDICRPGVGGLAGLAEILNGTVSPSGHLVDEWPVDFTADPTWYNFGNNSQNSASSTYRYEDGTATGSSGTSTQRTGTFHGIDYEEGIYLGYKYYETYYYDKYNGGDAAGAQQWYDDHVAFPFGYGLSYTSFSMTAGALYTDEGLTSALGSSVDASLFDSSAGSEAQVETLYLPVTVKNTGNAAGKEVVQVYVTAPYTKGGIEKSSVVLAGFAKTKLLQPGESETVTVAFNVQDFASWDYLDANNDGVKGDYELDAGAYIVRVMESSHFDCATDVNSTSDAYDEVRFTLGGTAHLKLDDFSGLELENLFSEENGIYTADTKDHDMAFNSVRNPEMMADGASGMTVMSRADFDGTFPTVPTTADLTFHSNVIDNWAYWDEFRVDDTPVMSGGLPTADVKKAASYDEESDPWYKSKEDIPENWTQAEGTYDENHLVVYNRTTLQFAMNVSDPAESPIKFSEMAGVAWDDPKWDDFLNQLTYDELCTMVEFSGYSTADIASVGKLKSMDADGPNNLSMTHCWCSEDCIASTWNTELAEKEGRLVGDIAMFINMTGWYGPGMDTHRSPFSGRNNEYYSQDGVQGGYIAAAVVKGAQDKGMICYVKHCLLNDQETDRGVLFVWVSEQALRENYAKVFQMALQEGGSKAAMTGYAREAGFANTSNYNLNTRLYIDQWGTNAYFVTDGYIGWQNNADPDIMVRSGNQVELYTTPYVEYLSGEWDAAKNTVMVGPAGEKTESYTQWYNVRMTAKSVLYNVASTTGNFNGYSEIAISGGALASGTQGLSYTADVGVSRLLSEGSSAVCSLSMGKLPAGLTLNENTGAISGTPTESGDFTFGVTYTIDSFVSSDATYTLNIAPAFEMDPDGDPLDSAQVGRDFMARITSDEYTTDKYETVEYRVVSGALPAGVELDTDGTLRGTPTQDGVYTATVQMTATEANAGNSNNGSGSGGGSSEPAGKTLDYALTIIVADEDGNIPEGAENLDASGEEAAPAAAAPASESAPSASADKGDSGNGLSIAALIVGILGLCGAGYAIFAGKGKKENEK